MTSIVNTAFAEWTDGLDTRESMISIFSHIRDIPYFLMAPASDHATSAEQLLITGKGSCGPKHYLLVEMFRKLNLSVVFATIAFSWNDPDLLYPPRLREMAARLPIAHHLACRVQVGCRWILVDATWDRPLSKAGFPVNDHWDGYSETRCAVKPLNSPMWGILCTNTSCEQYPEKDKADLSALNEEKVHWVAADQEQYYREKVSIRTKEERNQLIKFYHDFDAWLVEVRKQ